jgi:hypothetical protein
MGQDLFLCNMQAELSALTDPPGRAFWLKMCCGGVRRERGLQVETVGIADVGGVMFLEKGYFSSLSAE